MSARDTDINVSFNIKATPLDNLNKKIDGVVAKTTTGMTKTESAINKTAQSFSKVDSATSKINNKINKTNSMFNIWGRTTQNVVSKITVLDAKVAVTMDRAKSKVDVLKYRFDQLGNGIKKVGSTIAKPFTTAFKAIDSKVKGTASNIKFFGSSVKNAVKNSNTVSKISTAFGKVKTSLSKVTPPLQKLPSLFKKTGDSGKTAGEKAKSGMENMTSSVFKGVTAANLLAGAFNKVKSAFTGAFSDAMDMEQTQLALDALVGDADKSAKLFDMLNQKGASSVFSESDFLTGGKALLPLTKDLGDIEKGMNVMERLAMSNMEQGMEGATFSMREYLSGDYTSIVERFNLPRSMVKKSLEGADTIQERMEALDKLLQGMGFTDDYVAKVNTSTGAVVDNIVSNVKMKFTKAMKGVLDNLKDPLLKFQAWIESGALDKVFSKLGSIMTKGVEGALKVFEWITDNKDLVVSALAGITAGFIAFKVLGLTPTIKKVWALTTALLANPITWVALAIGLLVGAFVLLYKKSETFRNAVNNLWAKLKEFATEVWETKLKPAIESMKQAFSKLWNDTLKPALEGFLKKWNNDIKPAIIDMWNNHVKPFISEIIKGLKKLKDTAVKLWNEHLKPFLSWLGTTLKNIWTNSIGPLLQKTWTFIGKIIDLLKFLWTNVIMPIYNWIMENIIPKLLPVIQYLGDTFSNVFGTISSIIGGLMKSLGGLIDFIIGVFTGDWSRAWQGIQDIFGGIWDGLKAIAQGAINAVIDVVNFGIRELNKFSVDIPDGVPGVGGKHIGINITELSHVQFEEGTHGKYNTPDTFIAGEAGPELIVGAEGRRVLNNDETNDALAPTSARVSTTNNSNTYNITINVQGGDNPQQTAKSVREELEDFFASFNRRNPRVREV